MYKRRKYKTKGATTIIMDGTAELLLHFKLENEDNLKAFAKEMAYLLQALILKDIKSRKLANAIDYKVVGDGSAIITSDRFNKTGKMPYQFPQDWGWKPEGRNRRVRGKRTLHRAYGGTKAKWLTGNRFITRPYKDSLPVIGQQRREGSYFTNI